MAISCSNIDTLPEDCVSKILTYTSPLDACNFSMVSSTLHSAANSDSLWRSFLPSDYEDIISRTLNPLTLQSCSSYKHLFFSLCQQPLLLDRGHIVSRIHLQLISITTIHRFHACMNSQWVWQNHGQVYVVFAKSRWFIIISVLILTIDLWYCFLCNVM